MIILHKQEIEKYLHLDARLTAGLQLIKDGIADQQPLGRTDDSEQMYHNVQCYETKQFEDTRYESHEKWIDIQYIRSGQERIDVLVSAAGAECTEHNKEADCLFYRTEDGLHGNQLNLKAGMLAVFYPEDLHRPCICVDGPEIVEKVVFKIRV